MKTSEFTFGNCATLIGNITESSPLIDPPENTILSAVTWLVHPAGAWAVTPVSGVSVGRSISTCLVLALSSSFGTLNVSVALVPPGLASLLCTVTCAEAAAATRITSAALAADTAAARANPTRRRLVRGESVLNFCLLLMEAGTWQAPVESRAAGQDLRRRTRRNVVPAPRGSSPIRGGFALGRGEN